MDRASLLELWTASWDKDIWIAPWSKALADLSVDQALWSPAQGRHNIWHNVNHVVFWRSFTLCLLSGGLNKPTREEAMALNFKIPDPPTAAAWEKDRARLAESHEQIRGAIADERNSTDRLRYHLAHDAYHLGQIMYLRALQGLKPIE